MEIRTENMWMNFTFMLKSLFDDKQKTSSDGFNAKSACDIQTKTQWVSLLRIYSEMIAKILPHTEII